MNERLLELAQRAHEWATEESKAGKNICHVGSDYFLALEKEKFAELIIQECINKQLSLASNFEAVAEGYEPTFPEFVEGTINGLKEGVELIKQHFGVM